MPHSCLLFSKARLLFERVSFEFFFLIVIEWKYIYYNYIEGKKFYEAGILKVNAFNDRSIVEKWCINDSSEKYVLFSR